MKRIIWLQATVIVMLVVVLVLHVISIRRDHEERVGELLEQIESLENPQPQEGGLETELPPAQPQSSEWTFPISPQDYVTLTSPFGHRVSPILNIEVQHQGVDIAAAWRSQVVAAADGVVVDHWPIGTYGGVTYRGHDIYGGMIEIEHENGWRTLYAHLSSTRVGAVRIGARVEEGQVIGRVGGTGLSRGEHLHFEMRDATGNPLNPLLYVGPQEGEEG